MDGKTESQIDQATKPKDTEEILTPELGCLFTEQLHPWEAIGIGVGTNVTSSQFACDGVMKANFTLGMMTGSRTFSKILF
jgi:hypothetical protein